ncbi:MAG: YkgJ family cysteine cluster protein [Sulfurimonas sp.]|jgi:Fe-S-cluster containining protein|nr:YkgJ family cysteine cluster protein [Sulfurimonadaceae bacterium]
MSDLITKEGFSYKFDPKACALCEAKCCTGDSGYIYVSSDEIENIAKYLKMNEREFIDNFLYKVGFKYSIKERKVGESYECAFYSKKHNICTIYDVRPNQCITFPFWEHFKENVEELKKECIGVVDV